jgi:hypothetical protein
MQAIRIEQRLDSETLHLPQLRPWVEKDVEIIILEAVTRSPNSNSEYPLRGSILRDDDPFGPAVVAEEWEAAR